jgi:DNA-3-methyladenine glycosylase
MGRTDALKPARRKDGHLPLARSELPIDTVSLARYLIGKVLVRELPEGVASGGIVETEAYVVGDAAGHAYRGMTRRNRSLFLERGHAYIYLAYGSAYMLNVSSEMPGIGAGVLIRALEPLKGIPLMQLNRGIERLRDLARGPGRLTAVLCAAIKRTHGAPGPVSHLRADATHTSTAPPPGFRSVSSARKIT